MYNRKKLCTGKGTAHGYIGLKKFCFSRTPHIRDNIHPSIHFSIPSIRRFAGGLEPIPAVIGREAAYSLDGSPVHHRSHRDKRDTQPCTLTSRDNLESPINLTCVFLGGSQSTRRKPTHTRRKPTHTRREHRSSTQKGPSLLLWGDSAKHHTTAQPFFFDESGNYVSSTAK